MEKLNAYNNIEFYKDQAGWETGCAHILNSSGAFINDVTQLEVCDTKYKSKNFIFV